MKFFAYFEARGAFKHSVKDFLNGYMESKMLRFHDKKLLADIFDKTMQALAQSLPNGIVRSNRTNSTPLVLFEAIAVGVADIVNSGASVDPAKLVAILDDPELKKLTTGATNSLPKLTGRINYVSEHARA